MAGRPVTWRRYLTEATARLGSATEARWLVEEAASAPWPDLLDEPVTTRAAAHLERHLARRAGGEPLQYVLGRWAFRTLDLLVDRRVLIPRPETETVVEVALGELDDLAAARPGAELVVADLGTGSGAIALAIAAERRRVEVWATDVSAGALDVAAANLAGLGGRAARQVHLVAGSWWDALPPDRRGRLDLVVSNPPYVATAEMAGLDPVVVDWEPRLALEAGPGGLEAAAEILAGAGSWLAPGGRAVLEIAPHQAEAAAALARRAGFAEVGVRADLVGRDRSLVARLARAPRPGGEPACGASGRAAVPGRDRAGDAGPPGSAGGSV